jgi:D-cysteine desulfhydrase family pyridoxal phosphate-dependent enzyme
MKMSMSRVALALLPTPLEPLRHLSEALGGPSIFVKRDDLTGLALGGNKVRKLEFLLGQALQQRANSIVTTGAVQSNHCRLTAAAAARLGLRCVLVLRGDRPVELTGNLLLDRLFGADVRWAGSRAAEEVVQETVEEERKSGRRPYAIPVGGSTGLGASAYVLAMEELIEQGVQQFDRIVLASSSGGTHAGLVVGAYQTGFAGEVLGISVDEPVAALRRKVAGIATDTTRLLGYPRTYKPEEIRATDDYLGGGYAVMGAAEREAIQLFARSEGIVLDPVYTGRAAAGMLDLIRRGYFRKDESVLFWHTGGAPALWAYARELASDA